MRHGKIAKPFLFFFSFYGKPKMYAKIKWPKLTGDTEEAAARVSRQVGLPLAKARALPDTKQGCIKDLQNKGYIVTMVSFQHALRKNARRSHIADEKDIGHRLGMA
jgi:hypothetical protein